MSRRVVRWIISATVLLTITAAAPTYIAAAQESINYASVGGRVTDPQGALVADAQVAARQTETNQVAEAVTDREGRFRFPYLKVGSYEITISKDGFAPSTRVLTLTVGAAFELPVALSIESLVANVTVSGEATVLEAARSQIAGTVSQAEVRSVPMNGRNFLDLALLVPGVSPTNVGSTQLFAETSAVPGQGISIGSQRNFSNSFIVDGLSANDDAAGLSGIPYGVDAVDQFQVVTSGGQAELGRALGGYVNVVTKSGTNVLHGDIYDYVRNSRFNSENALSGTRLPMSQKQYGVSFGGPVARDRTFYFTNFEQRKLDQSGLVTISSDAPDNVSTINARLAAIGYPGSPITTGVYSNPVHTTNLLGKVDHLFNGHDQFSLRYSLYDVTSANSRGAGALNAPSASAGLDNIDQTMAFGNTLTLSPRTVNETRAQFTYSDLQALPSDPVGPAVSIAGVASFGTLSGSPTRRVNKMYQVVDNLSYQTGAHALRAGVDFLYNDDTITYPRSIRGSYAFSSLANFLAGVYNNSGFTQTFGDDGRIADEPERRCLRAGRVEGQPSPDAERGPAVRPAVPGDDQAPTGTTSRRAWDLRGHRLDSRRTVVRGSAGLFFDRVPLRAVANALLSAGNTTDLGNLRQTSISLSPTQAGAPVFPNILSAPVPSVTLFNLTTMDRDMQNAYSRQASVEIEQQIGDRSTVSIGYQYVRGLNLIMSVNQNVPTCVAAGTNNGCRPIANYANNSQYSPVADSNYHGLHRLVRAAAGALGELPRQLHLLEVDEQRGRGLLQLAHRSDRHLEGLGSVR